MLWSRSIGHTSYVADCCREMSLSLRTAANRKRLPLETPKGRRVAMARVPLELGKKTRVPLMEVWRGKDTAPQPGVSPDGECLAGEDRVAIHLVEACPCEAPAGKVHATFNRNLCVRNHSARGVFRRAVRSTRTRQQWKPAFAVLVNCVSDSEAFVCLFVCLFVCFVCQEDPRARPSCRPPRPSSCPPRPAQHSSTQTPRGRALRGVLQPRPGGAATLPLPEGRS